MTKIHLGCGGHYIQGWTNVDLDSPLADVHLDLRKALPYADASVDYVFNEHFIEHLTREDGISLLKECRRILKPGGVLRISTPNLRWVAAQYLGGKLDEWADVGYLPETSCRLMNESMRFWGHQFVYDMPELVLALQKAGFAKLVGLRHRQSMHPDLVGLECRPWHEELIVEASK